MSIEYPNPPLYLMDSRVVESVNGIRLDVNQPKKAGVVLSQEMPWEAFYMQPHSLVHHDGEYLLYYLVYIVNDGLKRTETCLAISRDGLHWERPELGQVDYAGSKANNILSVGGAVSIDPTAPPERRFLMSGPDKRSKQGDPNFVLDGIALHGSPDGRVWTQLTPALSPFTHDSTNQVFYDAAKGKYVAYVRACPPGLGRSVGYYEAENVFEPWPIRPASTNAPSSYTTPYGPVEHYYVIDELPIAISWRTGMEPYNPGVVPNEGMYLAFPDVFRIFPGPHHPDKERFPDSELYKWFNDGLVAPRLYISEDGVSFRPVGEAPYIDLGFGDELDSQQVRMATGMIRHGDEVWQYYSGHQTGHTLARGERPRKACGVMRAIQRKDGFAGMKAGVDGGDIVTSPIKCVGEHLEVNYAAGAWGEVMVELLDAAGSPVTGYMLSDSAALVGNSVYERVQWADRKTLSAFMGDEVRLRFRLTNASLFSFRFANHE
ncbi:MAG: hypothetical protein M1133_03670 [Armatimonadetes bacterium]|nr:hypothetical protein [Armatimonadota bacterium]